MHHVNYAHRGASSYAPENTLRSFYMGLEMGADGIETDVHLSADGVPVLFHDHTLDRVTDCTGAVEDFTAAQLGQVQVFCPDFPERRDTICTLEEFLRHFGWRDLTFAIELKGAGAEEKTLALLEQYGMREKTIVTSFVREYLEKAMAIAPDWRYGWLAEDFTEDDVAECAVMGLYQLCPRARNLTEDKVRGWKAAGFSVRAWGVADTELMRHALRCGTDGQTVNFPDKLAACLQKNR
jgi:glycerophosphoryl diester phosphodiesterase